MPTIIGQLGLGYWLMAVAAVVAFLLAVRAMRDVALGHELPKEAVDVA